MGLRDNYVWTYVVLSIEQMLLFTYSKVHLQTYISPQ